MYRTLSILIVLVLGDVTLGVRRRLENRLKVLEDKVFYDSSEFREDIKRILGILNGTVKGELAQIEDGSNDQADAKCVKFSDKFCEEEEESIHYRQELELLKLGFAKEKLRLRQYITTLESSLEQVQTVLKAQYILETQLMIAQNDTTDMQTEMMLAKEYSSNQVQRVLRAQKAMEAHFLIAQNDTAVMQKEMMVATDALNRFSSEQTEIRQTIKRYTVKVDTMFPLFLTKMDTNDKWKRFNNSYYSIGELGTASWRDAKQKCETIGAYLVEVNSREENDFVNGLLSSALNTRGFTLFWLGGSDSSEEGVWKWSHSNDPLDFSMWKTGEPNDANNEDCLHMYTYTGGWNDRECESPLGFVCELSV